jgi:hypothetical protein
MPATVTIVPAGWPAPVEQVAAPTDVEPGPYQGGTLDQVVAEATASGNAARLAPGAASAAGGAPFGVELPQPRLRTAIETTATRRRP